MKTILVGVITVLSVSLPAGASAAAPRGGQAAISPCTGAGISMSASWQKKNAQLPGGGAVDGTVVFTPAAGTRCTLTGWPKLRLYAADGNRLATQQRNLPGSVSPPRAVTLRNSGGIRKSATVHVTWMNWCKGAVSGPLSLHVRLPGASAFRTAPIRPGAKAVASCVNPTAGSVLDVQPFMAAAA